MTPFPWGFFEYGIISCIVWKFFNSLKRCFSNWRQPQSDSYNNTGVNGQSMDVCTSGGDCLWGDLFLNEFSLYLSTGEDNSHSACAKTKQKTKRQLISRAEYSHGKALMHVLCIDLNHDKSYSLTGHQRSRGTHSMWPNHHLTLATAVIVGTKSQVRVVQSRSARPPQPFCVLDQRWHHLQHPTEMQPNTSNVSIWTHTDLDYVLKIALFTELQMLRARNFNWLFLLTVSAAVWSAPT